MARPFFTGALLLILLQACSKSHSPKPGLMGQWRLIKVVNTLNMNPGTIGYDQETLVLQLKPDSTYMKTNAGALAESGTFSIVFNSRSVSDTTISFSPSNNDPYTRVAEISGLELHLRDVDSYEVYHKQ